MPTDMTTLPPGWEAKIDKKSGKTYYINHQDKTTTWDHPCKTFPKKWTSNTNGYPKNTGTEYIGLQHGSPDFKRNYVYPSQHSPLPAFQVSPHQSPKINLLQDFSPRSRGSPLTVRPKTQESPLSSNSVNTDEAVSKIAAMFPTVSEAHIRLLMKNCRYMKSIFPKAEETLILEILSNHDNNIQKSSEKLREMGFEKKDSLKISQQKYEMQVKSEEDKEEDPKSPSPIPKVLTTQEKETVKSDVQKEHQDIPEQLIQIALESVDFDREKARNLLKGITLVESKTEEGKIVEYSEVDNEAVGKKAENLLPVSMSRQSLKSLLKSERVEKEKVKISRGNDSGYKSNNLSSVVGPNPALAKGNKENLLLEDYVKWLGPDRTICKGANPGLVKGPSASNKIDKRVGASGPNSDNRKGPNKSLVKGSIFSQMKATAGVAGESRGK